MRPRERKLNKGILIMSEGFQGDREGRWRKPCKKCMEWVEGRRNKSDGHVEEAQGFEWEIGRENKSN